MPKGSREAAKTHCPKGHPYDVENTRICQGKRVCRRCGRDRYRAKMKKLTGGRIIIPHADKTHCPKGHPYDERNTKRTRFGRACRTCDLETHILRDNANPEKMMWTSAKHRAKLKGVKFEITPQDITIPLCCPVLGTTLARKATKGPADTSPTLDRLQPEKGYVVGNIAVISLRANRIKNDATLEELEKVTSWLRAALKNGDN